MKRLLVILSLLIPIFSFGQVCGPYSPHAPISLDGVSGQIIERDSINCGGTGTVGISLSNCHDMIIRYNKILNSTNVGIYLINCYNITIDTNRIENVASGGTSVDCPSGSIVVNYNEFKNMVGPLPKGQFWQFNNTHGAGNSFQHNKCLNQPGSSYPEDAVSMYNSSGTSTSPLTVAYNLIKGGGPSTTGGGIMCGDNGGLWEYVHDNILVDPGQYGLAISGGDPAGGSCNIIISNNKVYARQQSFTNVGVYVITYTGPTINGATIGNNLVNWTNSSGASNGDYLGTGENTPTDWGINTFSASIDSTIIGTPFFTPCSGVVAPSISYSPASESYTVGTSISAYSPTNTGGAVVSWSISPGLPAGLNFNTSTGVITGTPTAAHASTSYTITATNTGGSGSTGITIVVSAALTAPVISYTPSTNTYSVGATIAPLSPVNAGGAAASFSISPALPTGLTFNTSSGVISGTPTVTSTSTGYTVTGTNTAGSGTAPINVTVTAAPPLIIFKRKIKMI